ncbi:MAG: hypothetical protein ACRDSL_21850 [Pseudonocardiaceae bacterium]
MAAWREVVDSEPEFAHRVQAIMDAHLHKTIATLRADGSPRISGIEASSRPVSCVRLHAGCPQG